MSNSKVVYKYDLPIDDEWHALPMGNIVHVGSAVNGVSIRVWIEQRPLESHALQYRVFGTGHAIEDFHEHVGTTLDGRFVWHIYRRCLPENATHVRGFLGAAA